MRQQQLGDRTVTCIGCGDVRLATAADRGVDARDVERAVLTALELGISLIEASEEEAAERLCGEAVRAMRLRDRVVVACRVPELPARPGAPRRDGLPERLPPAYVQQRIEASLRATRLDALPLAQLSLRGAWRASRVWPELVGTCARLVREGKVLAWGALCGSGGGRDGGAAAEGDGGGSNGGGGGDAELAREPWLASISIPFSLCERGAEAVLAGGGSSDGGTGSEDAGSSPGAGAGPKVIFARRPLAGGALAGTLGPGARLALRDDRRSLDDAALERIAVLAAKLAPLVEREPPAARSCEAARAVLEGGRRPPHVEALTLAELALRFVLDRGAVALPRLSRAERIPEAIAAASAPPLSQALLDRLVELVA